jgi:hypothetical protein
VKHIRVDPDLGRPVRYLFLRNGVLANNDYLFARPLARICEDLAILNGDGKPAIHAHRFRHTLGTQLAEKGARTQTIMKILGHQSAGMSMTYANISDPVVLADYQSVVQPGAVIAGPLADTLRVGQLGQDGPGLAQDQLLQDRAGTRPLPAPAAGRPV